MSERYDVVIIGAGISGLICGCYLVKRGLRVLIVEQYSKPGGYCTSFERSGYRFDVGIHYLGGVKRGILAEIIKELDLKEEIKFNQYDPTDKIIIKEHVTYLRADPFDTVNEFKKSFPGEKRNIEKFFMFVTKNNFADLYRRTRYLSFGKFLDSFFSDYNLKATFGILVGNIGVSPKKASAFSCLTLFTQYLLDPGYYPVGGIQELPDALVRTFKKNKGDLILSNKAIRIIAHNKKIKQVILQSGEKINTDIIVSNADATQTFKELLNIEGEEANILDKLTLTPSTFLVYLGLNNIRKILTGKYNIFYFSTYDIDRIYSGLGENILKDRLDWIVCSFPSLHDSSIQKNKDTMMILFFAPFKSNKFWLREKEVLSEKMIQKAEEILPNLRNYVKLKIIATPHTLYRYTSNYRGAFAGWAPVYSTRVFIPQKTSINGLYLTGHWCNTGYLPYGGISNVSFLGKRCATLILQEKKIISSV